MNREDIKQLVAEYKEALAVEFTAKLDVEQQEQGIKEKEQWLISEAYAEGEINGKNAETRKAQEAGVLGDDDWLPKARDVLAKRKIIAAEAEHTRKAYDAEIGLTKAWLYSQSGR